MTGPPVTLASLAFGWGDAYLFSYVRDRWVALRRDTPRFLTAGTLAGLEATIEADYRDHPVPRACDPPSTADYLSPPDDDVPDEESRRSSATPPPPQPPTRPVAPCATTGLAPEGITGEG